MAIVLAAMVMIVVIPLLFFTSVAFSSSAELSEFPKNIFARSSVTVKVEPTDDGQYELFYDKGDGKGYRSILTSSDPQKFETHFKAQYNVCLLYTSICCRLKAKAPTRCFRRFTANGGITSVWRSAAAWNAGPAG